MKKYFKQCLRITLNSSKFSIFQIANFSTPNTASKLNLELIKILRQETNSPLNHIKKALEECNNDLEESKVWLKKKGFKDAENKKSRLTAIKLIGLKPNTERSKLAISSVSCETDFVANTDYFRDFSSLLLDTILTQGKQLTENDFASVVLNAGQQQNFKGSSIAEGLKVVIAKTQENCTIGTAKILTLNNNECVGYYLHNSPAENLGVKASFVILSTDSNVSSENKEKLAAFADNLAMHIVAANSKFCKISDVPVDVLEKEKAILEEQSKNIAKNKDFSKILANKVEKWYEDHVLLEQTYMINDHEDMNKPKKVSEVLKSFAKENQLNKLEIIEFNLLI